MKGKNKTEQLANDVVLKAIYRHLKNGASADDQAH
jgi:hypothetical protein